MGSYHYGYMSLEYFRSLKSLETTDRFLPNLILIYIIGGQSNLWFFFPTATATRTVGKRIHDVEANRKATCVFVCVLRVSIRRYILLPKLIKLAKNYNYERQNNVIYCGLLNLYTPVEHMINFRSNKMPADQIINE